MKKSLNRGNIKKLDKSKMLDLLLDFPGQCLQAQEIAKTVQILFERRDFSKIVFAGLGGSAIGADLVKAYLYFESKIPITVVREYDLPSYVDSSTLVFICSYSGNTEETLSALAQAEEKKATIIAISSDGKIKELSEKDKLTFIKIPEGQPPRSALGYLSIIPLCVLAKLGLIKDVSFAITETIKTLEDLRDNNLSQRIGQKDNIAKYAANKLYNKLPIIYASAVHFDVAATRFRCQLNENSKALASSHIFPEMNHNEIVGWQNPKKLFKNLIVIMFKDKGMHPRVLRRMEITKELILKEGVEIFEIWSKGDSLLSRIFSLIYTGDFISYYLAILYGIDPTPVEKVTYLKNKLTESK